MRMYSVEDKVAEEYFPPFLAINDGIATRIVRDMLSKVPQDVRNEHRLWYIGTFDKETGVILTSSPIEVSIYKLREELPVQEQEPRGTQVLPFPKRKNPKGE